MKFTLLLLGVSSAAAAQGLKVSPVSGAPGDKVRVEISLESPSGKAPSTLQWETIFPAQLLDVEGDGPEIAQAAKESGKSVSCATHKPYSYVCVLFGGQKPIADGSIATFRFKIRKDARLGATTIHILNIGAVAGDFKQVPLKDAEGVITIR